jgi:hypothetical protein
LINNELLVLAETGGGWQAEKYDFVEGIGESFPQTFPQLIHRRSGFFRSGQLPSLRTFNSL